jgi:hypothetical protein
VPAAGPVVPAAGPVRIGLTVAAAKAALPKATVRETLSKHTNKPIAVEAKAAWTLEDQPYLIKLTPQRYGAATMLVAGVADGIDVDACRKRLVALTAHFNQSFDAIEGRRWVTSSRVETPQTGVSFSVQRTPDGVPYVVPMPTWSSSGRYNDEDDDEGRPVDSEVSAGRNAIIGERASADGYVTWEFGQAATKAYPYSLKGSASFAPYGAQSQCDIKAIVRAEPFDRPREEVLDPAIKPLPYSARLLHTSLDGVEVPATPISFGFRCMVWRTLGRVTTCRTTDNGQEKHPLMRAARKRAYETTFEVAKLDPDSDVPLVADVSVQIAPGDRLSAEAFAALPPPPPVAIAPVSAPPRRYIPMSAGPVIWERTVTYAELASAYPKEALVKSVEARVTATCKLKDDLTLDCPTLESDPPGITVFDEAVRKILSRFKAQPKLKDGKPAAGTEVKVPLRFELE